jgi:phosphoadenosine phosphosulfate reductase
VVTDAEALDARELLTWGLERFHPQMALACSFQKEETVLLDLMFELEPDARVFALDTGVLFDETYELWRAAEERYGTVIEAWRGKWVDGLWAQDPSGCCALRKVEPLGRALAPLDAWVTGVRREQAPTRAGAAKLGWDAAHGLWKVNPLADWSEDQVWDYIHAHDIPYNPLHDEGYPSLGCTHCTRKPAAGEDSRAGRWAGSEKTECGLHG